MPPFQFRIQTAIHRARRLTHAPGVSISLPGVRFAGELSASEAAVWRLLFLALGEDRIDHYWNANECCEGCVSNFQPVIRKIESLVRLTRSSLGGDISPVSAALLSALSEGFVEYREYIGSFVPRTAHDSPWGEGNRTDYLNAMRALRNHLKDVLRQAMRLLDNTVHFNGTECETEEWPRQAYSATAVDLDL